MKTIEINQDELVKYIVEKCDYYFYNWVNGGCCRHKVKKGVCDLHTFADELRCPLDCPRLEVKEYGCDKGRCPGVRAVIKKLKA